MNDSTKAKILKESHKLFAEKGFNGVSVREIAKVCDVNVAAINYHFKNKENLYVEIFRQSILSTQRDVKNIFDNLEVKSIELLSKTIYRHFIENSEDLRMSFKLVLSQTHFENAFEGMHDKYNGPPGGEYLHECLLSEVPDAKHEDVEWAVRVLFSQIIHKAIVTCNSSICEHLVDKAGWDKDIFEQDIVRLAKLVKTEISKSE